MLVRAIGWLSAVMFLFGSLVAVQYFRSLGVDSPFPYQLRLPSLAIEFAGNSGEVLTIVNAVGKAKLKSAVNVDYGFIVAYTLQFLGLVAVLARRRVRLAVPFAVIAALCAIGTASFDVMENLRITAAIEERLGDVASIKSAGTGKWLFCFATIAALSLVFMVRRGWVAAVGFLCHLIAAIGLFGLAFNPRMVELAFILIIITLMPAIAWLFLRFPEYFEDKDL